MRAELLLSLLDFVHLGMETLHPSFLRQARLFELDAQCNCHSPPPLFLLLEKGTGIQSFFSVLPAAEQKN